MPESRIKMDDHVIPEADEESCFYINWELIEWMTEPCHPYMSPRSDNG